MKDWINGAKNRKFIASYSGGKDSTLALYKAMEEGEPLGIIVMMEKEGDRSRAHGISPKLLELQAKNIGVPLYMGNATWEEYEGVFIDILKKAKEDGAEALVTGDIDVPSENCWHERVTDNVGMKLSMPLWRRGHKDVVLEFINLGFITKVVTVNLKSGMKRDDLGKILTLEYVRELEERGIDPCGENGEFHTTVIGGPLFKENINVYHKEFIEDGDFIYLTLDVK